MLGRVLESVCFKSIRSITRIMVSEDIPSRGARKPRRNSVGSSLSGSIGMPRPTDIVTTPL